MPLKLPNLDDRNFADLVDEAVAMLPRCAPEWTNRNASDPGITLIELLAYFSEMLIYRLNRVTRENKIGFLQLLREVPSDERHHLTHTPVAEVEEALRQAVLDLRQPQRAVTCADYELLARQLTSDDPDMPKVARALCLARRDLEQEDYGSHGADRPGHVSLVLVPDRDLAPGPLKAFVKEVRAELDAKRLLTTRLHVVEPYYLWVTLSCSVMTDPGVRIDQVREQIEVRVEGYFNPLAGGGPTGDGWPFGRGLHLSEIFEQIEAVDGVDYVRYLRVRNLSTTEKSLWEVRTAIGIQIGVTSTVGADSRIGCEIEIDSERLILDGAGKLMGIALRPYELVRIKLHMEDGNPELPLKREREAETATDEESAVQAEAEALTKAKTKAEVEAEVEGGREAQVETETAAEKEEPEVEREERAVEEEEGAVERAVDEEERAVDEEETEVEEEVAHELERETELRTEREAASARELERQAERAPTPGEQRRERSRVRDERLQRALYVVGKGKPAEIDGDEGKSSADLEKEQ